MWFILPLWLWLRLLRFKNSFIEFLTICSIWRSMKEKISLCQTLTNSGERKKTLVKNQACMSNLVESKKGCIGLCALVKLWPFFENCLRWLLSNQLYFEKKQRINSHFFRCCKNAIICCHFFCLLICRAKWVFFWLLMWLIRLST